MARWFYSPRKNHFCYHTDARTTMETIVDVILSAGRSALDVSLYTLFPIMVVMTIVLRLLEVITPFVL